MRKPGCTANWSVETERVLESPWGSSILQQFHELPPPCSGENNGHRYQDGLGSLWIPGVCPSPSPPGDSFTIRGRGLELKGWPETLHRNSSTVDFSSTSLSQKPPLSPASDDDQSLFLFITLFISPSWQNYDTINIYIMRLRSGLHSGLCGP